MTWRARRASPLQSLAEARLNTKQTNILLHKYKGIMSLPYRRSVRFSKSHYNKGFYFVTICTRDRIHCFGDIVDGVMHLDELGEFVTQVLQTIREHNRYAECILFVVMPNHIHAIFAIDLKNVPTAHFVGGCGKSRFFHRHLAKS